MKLDSRRGGSVMSGREAKYLNEKLLVIGQGYVGLPIAMAGVLAGFSVVGLDIDPRRVDLLLKADSYVEDISNETLLNALKTGRYLPTAEAVDGKNFDVCVITVPTPLRDSMPDLSYIEDAGKILGPLIKKGSTVILESTTYPGTTEELLVPILEKGSGLQAGTDFFVGYSPERIDPGNQTWKFENTPKIVSGINADSLIAVQLFYSRIVAHVITARGCKEAELAKLLENTFRHVNIALINELAMFAAELKIDVWNAIDLASTKPFGFMRFTPGPGVGGHCLPIDPSYLSWRVKSSLGRQFRFVELANDVNARMPHYVVRRLMVSLNKSGKPLRGSRILVLGIAYKKNSGDCRESPAVEIVHLLVELGALVEILDPHVRIAPTSTKSMLINQGDASAYDAVLLLTDHDLFDYERIRGEARFIFDTRRRLPQSTNVEYL